MFVLKILGMTFIAATIMYFGIKVIFWCWLNVIGTLFGAVEDYFE